MALAPSVTGKTPRDHSQTRTCTTSLFDPHPEPGLDRHVPPAVQSGPASSLFGSCSRRQKSLLRRPGRSARSVVAAAAAAALLLASEVASDRPRSTFSPPSRFRERFTCGFSHRPSPLLVPCVALFSLTWAPSRTAPLCNRRFSVISSCFSSPALSLLPPLPLPLFHFSHFIFASLVFLLLSGRVAVFSWLHIYHSIQTFFASIPFIPNAFHFLLCHRSFP